MPLWQPTNAISRPVYYDRIPVPVLANAGVAVAGHATVVRWSYAPPTSYAAFIESIYSQVSRVAVGAPSATANDTFNFLPFFGGTDPIMINSLFDLAALSTQQITLTSFGYMAYGDALEFTTQDGSTGGLVFHAGYFKGTEFLY